MADDGVPRTKVYRNLNYKWTFLGLTQEDFILVILAPMGVNVAVQFTSLHPIWTLIAPVIVFPVLVLMKYRRPDNYLHNLLLSAFSPKRLDHKERRCYLPAFPVPSDESELK